MCNRDKKHSVCHWLEKKMHQIVVVKYSEGIWRKYLLIWGLSMENQGSDSSHWESGQNPGRWERPTVRGKLDRSSPRPLPDPCALSPDWEPRSLSLGGNRDNHALYSFDWSLQGLSLLRRVRLWWLKDNHINYPRHRQQSTLNNMSSLWITWSFLSALSGKRYPLIVKF